MKCVLRREQFVWRLIDGVRNGKGEYGFEILITLAFLVYWTGVPIDKACGILAFFTGLEPSKSQADSLLSQLATDWQVEYDAITEHQLCWAHFLRKAIALSLRNPDNRQYARFLKSLFAIYQSAVRTARDKRLSTGRAA